MKILLILLSLVAFGCSKEVSSSNGNLTNGGGQNPVIEVPTDSSTGTITMNFANHATVQESDDELTSYSLSEPLLLTFPTYISSITYSSSSSKPNLIVYKVNGSSYTPVCAYVWTGSTYRMYSTCADQDLTPNDRLQIKNIPRSQTVTLAVKYQR